MKLFIVPLAATMFAGSVASADELLQATHVASITDIGRVFMSPAERHELDRLRKAIPPQVGVGQASQNGNQSSTAGAANKKNRPGGYIVPSNGSPYKWKDGDFQRTTRGDINSELLPGDVSIIRHKGNAAEIRRANSSGEKPAQQADVETVSEPETDHDGIE